MTTAVQVLPDRLGDVPQQTPFQVRLGLIPPGWNIFESGGVGGGKTMGANFLGVGHANEYPDTARILWATGQAHHSNRDIADDTETLWIAAFGAKRVSRNRAEHIITLDTGASIEFAQIDAQSISRYSGRNFSMLIVDEAGELTTLKYIDRLRSRLRIPGITPRVVMIANPGGPSHSTLRKRYVDGRTPWHPFIAEDGETWVNCPSTYTMNPYLDHERYARQILASAGGDRGLATALLEGSWQNIGSAFWADVLSDRLWYPESDEWKPGDGWHTYCSTDWGISAPSCTLLCARAMQPRLQGPAGLVVPRDTIVVVDEVATCAGDDLNTGLGWVPAQLAEEIHLRCTRWNIRPRGCLDDARGLQGETLIEVFRAMGIYFEKFAKGRLAGWAAVKGRMAAVRDDDPDQPWLLINSRARYLAETLPLLQRDKIRPEDLDTRGPDHGADALAGAVTHRPQVFRSSHQPGALIY